MPQKRHNFLGTQLHTIVTNEINWLKTVELLIGDPQKFVFSCDIKRKQVENKTIKKSKYFIFLQHYTISFNKINKKPSRNLSLCRCCCIIASLFDCLIDEVHSNYNKKIKNLLAAKIGIKGPDKSICFTQQQCIIMNKCPMVVEDPSKRLRLEDPMHPMRREKENRNHLGKGKRLGS